MNSKSFVGPCLLNFLVKKNMKNSNEKTNERAVELNLRVDDPALDRKRTISDSVNGTKISHCLRLLKLVVRDV